jgi:hypothetical protein
VGVGARPLLEATTIVCGVPKRGDEAADHDAKGLNLDGMRVTMAGSCGIFTRTDAHSNLGGRVRERQLGVRPPLHW